MFEKLMKRSGWFENKTCLNEKGKPVAARHHQVAIRKQYKDSKPMTRCFADPEPKKKELKEEVDESIDDEEKNELDEDKDIKTENKTCSKKDSEDAEDDYDDKK